MIEVRGFHELVRRAQAGDRQAEEHLLAMLRPQLEQLAQGYVERESATESVSDVVQQTVLRVWQKLDQFGGASDDEQTARMFSEWVSQILRHVAINLAEARRALRRRPEQGFVRLATPGAGASTCEGGIVEPAASEASPSANAQTEEETQAVRVAVEGIPDETDRAIVRLRFFEGLSLHEIAERLDMSYDKVRQRSHASLRYLERVLSRNS